MKMIYCYKIVAHILIIAVSSIVISCSLFSTRNPEEPTSSRASFVPPTSPSTVISNFKSAIAEKNTENYISCLSDTARGGKTVFMFEPSAAVNAQYSGLFQLWNNSFERQSFLSIIGKMPTDIHPILQLTNARFDVISPDSAVYAADYILTVAHSVQTIPTSVAGYMRLSIAVQTGGLWSIIRWSDSSPSQPDSINATWSLLKAKFSN